MLSEIKVLSTTAMKTSLDELAPDFERATGSKLIFSFGPSARIAKMVADGEPHDVAIVTDRDPDGLEIIRHLDDSTDLVVTEGTIYPILARLSRDGMLSSEWREDGAHPRKYYRLTARGRRRLTEMTGLWEEFAGKLARLIAAARGDQR